MADAETKQLIASLQEQRESINQILKTQEDLFIKLNREVIRMQNSFKKLQLQVSELRHFVKGRGLDKETEEHESEPAEAEDDKPEVEEVDFREVALNMHNVYRSKHSARALRLDPALNQIAQSYADRLASMDQMIHSLNGYGENLYCSSAGSNGGSGSGPGHLAKCEQVKTAVASWYNEINLYDWGYPGFTSGTGRFTQLVWKSSSRMGIGVASNSKGTTYVVANYDPPGNEGRFEENVTNS